MSLHQLPLARTSFDTMVTDEEYRYRPLSASTTIRLIRICPEKVNGCIACRIYHIDEEDQETIGYHALSYLWGNSEHTRLIYLRGQGNEWHPFPLHENLWLFLDNAWQRGLFDQLFWTDYLCIDQNTHRELSQQVQRMHTIYSNAALVVIWLQLRKEEEDRFCDYLDLSDRLCQGKISRLGYLQESLDKHAYHHLESVTKNPYWGRIWIVQEVVVAKQVCVNTARTSRNLDELRSLLGLSHHLPHGEKPSIRTLYNMRAAGGKVPLWSIISDFKDYQCKHDVDRVFGILGLIEDNEDGSSPAANIKVNYEKPLSHVMLDVLFESPPPLNHLRDLMLGESTERLLPFELSPGLPAWFKMRAYNDDNRTTERHGQCARIALQFLEAFDIMWSVTGTTRSDKMELLTNLFQSAAKTDWKATRHQNAALIGMMLARPVPPRDEILDMFDTFTYDMFGMSSYEKVFGTSGWRERFYFLAQGKKSPWRCAAHGFRDPCHTDVGSYERVAAIATSSRAWNRAGLVEACGKQAEDCDGSTMTYELLEIGFRIQVETAINRGDDSRLSFHSMKFGTRSGKTLTLGQE